MSSTDNIRQEANSRMTSHLQNQQSINFLVINYNSVSYEQELQQEARASIAYNPATIKKNRIFGIALFVSQFTLVFLYAFLVQPQERSFQSVTSFKQLEFTPIFMTFAAYMFVLLGFGTILAYNMRLNWSGIGFTLLITIQTIQWYFMMNAFWTKVNIDNQGTQFSVATQVWEIFLGNYQQNFDFPPGSQIIQPRYRATLQDAVKCGLCNTIIFSSILGRAGPLQTLIISIVGTFGYELNRYVIGAVGNDYGYSSQIFLYAGVVAFMIGLIRSKNRNQQQTYKHQLYTGSAVSGSISMIGAIIIWIFFPILAMDQGMEFADGSSGAIYYMAYSIWYAISAGITANIGLSLIVYNRIILRDMIYTIIGAGIASASASYYITNPVYSMLIGIVSGAIQIIIGKIQKKFSYKRNIISTASWLNFVMNGFIGSLWASIFRASANNQPFREQFGFQLDLLDPQVAGFVMGVITIGIGLLTGLLLGIVIYFMTNQTRGEHFNDYTHWLPSDGIRYNLTDQSAQSSQAEFDVRQGLGVKQFLSYI